MVENLNNLVKQNAETSIINNTAIPNPPDRDFFKESSIAGGENKRTF
jgi:hypothetical protein